MRTRSVLSFVVAIAAGGFAGSASATRVNLGVYENANNASLLGIDLWVDVVDGPGSTVDFVFHNDSTAPAFISAIYFENKPASSGLSGGAIFAQSAGVNFSPPATPPNPAQPGFLFGGSWAGNLLSLDANSPSPTNGINHGGLESLTVRFNATGTNAAAVSASLRSNPAGFRIAQHVQGLTGGFSVWTINPAPGSLAILAVAGLAGSRRRR